MHLPLLGIPGNLQDHCKVPKQPWSGQGFVEKVVAGMPRAQPPEQARRWLYRISTTCTCLPPSSDLSSVRCSALSVSSDKMQGLVRDSVQGASLDDSRQQCGTFGRSTICAEGGNDFFHRALGPPATHRPSDVRPTPPREELSRHMFSTLSNIDGIQGNFPSAFERSKTLRLTPI